MIVLCLPFFASGQQAFQNQEVLEHIANMIFENKKSTQIEAAWRQYLDKNSAHKEDALVFIVDKARRLSEIKMNKDIAALDMPLKNIKELQTQLAVAKIQSKADLSPVTTNRSGNSKIRQGSIQNTHNKKRGFSDSIGEISQYLNAVNVVVGSLSNNSQAVNANAQQPVQAHQQSMQTISTITGVLAGIASALADNHSATAPESGSSYPETSTDGYTQDQYGGSYQQQNGYQQQQYPPQGNYIIKASQAAINSEIKMAWR